ncbi:hypothetical protein IGK15_001530 [Enterococcus sp. AZ045]|uniref:Predicted membrane GTPase involved in stress response n=1 Tax=Enterococcus mundtii TaxID=53346 RepID=A0AAI8R707_ENTMU|nr:hypothetical protein EMQU_1598 [Enterococcus mundtii QU 25]BBM13457.1 predicted membrane GTPase involved in stress response [Enterococcus mundtii]GKS55550.1 hypothetical protein EMLAB_21650 [Enterococcus mundtii]
MGNDGEWNSSILPLDFTINIPKTKHSKKVSSAEKTEKYWLIEAFTLNLS